MPTAKKDSAPKLATVSETIIRKETRDPVEVEVTPPKVPISPRQDFWKYIKSLTDDDWKTHHVTLYRYPLGQPKPDKLGRYIKTYKHGNPLLSEEQVYEEFGGSQYTAMLKGPKDGQPWTLIATEEWEMDGPAKNPWQISPTGTAAAVGGTELASTLQVLLPQLRTALQASPNAESPAIKESISLIQQLTSAMPKQQGIAELVSGLADLKKLTGDTGNGNSLRETLAVLKELGIIGVERRSIAQEIKEIMEIAGMLGGGGGAPARRADWPTALVDNLPSILEKVTPIADKFADAARSNARVAEIRAGGPRAVIPANTVPAALPPARPAVPAAVESTATRTVAAPETEPAGNGAEPQLIAPNMIWAKAKAVQMFQQGKPGDVVAEFLDNLDTQLGGFLASMNEEKFKQFIEGDAILRTIAPAPRYPSFVKDFVGYFSEEGEGAGHETEPTPAG